MDLNSAFQKLRQFSTEGGSENDIAAYVREKKAIMRASEIFVKVARENRKREDEYFKHLRDELKTLGKIKDPTFSNWDKYLKGR
jgi:hypothetical protein